MMTKEADLFLTKRLQMIESQLRARGINDEAVLKAMSEIPRETFVDEPLKDRAYEDGPIPIGHEQTLSQAYMVASMLEQLDLKSNDRLLEIGAGSGYAACVASRLCREVLAVERIEALALKAKSRIQELGLKNIRLVFDDGLELASREGPFEKILVSAAIDQIPLDLKKALCVHGRMVIPVGRDSTSQRLVSIDRTSETAWDDQELYGVRFVPLLSGTKKS